jgi:uncharacterized protein (TIGR02594 family)
MVNYRSLAGGYYSGDPSDRSVPVSVRMNNPGAINGDVAWMKAYPGFVTAIETTPGNKTAVFEAPEFGVGAWWTLMSKYAAGGYDTVGKIINRYGGSQDYSGYTADVSRRTGLAVDRKIDLYKDDPTLVRFARAMWRYEAGRESPLSDAQIAYGFTFARTYQQTGKAPVEGRPSTIAPPAAPGGGFWATLFTALAGLFGSKPKPLALSRTLKRGDMGSEVEALQGRLHQLGFSDLNIDGDYGELTEDAVRSFQVARNIQPSGIVDAITLRELNSAATATAQPPLLPPPSTKHGVAPPWYPLAEADIGFHEVGVNRGIERLIAESGNIGQLGDPYCAIGANAKLKKSGNVTSGSAMARSFENSANFIKLSGPALGAITTMWRESKGSGKGHVFFYDGESDKGVRGIGYNEEDGVRRSFHDRGRIVGYYWPKSYPMPVVGPIHVNSDLPTGGSEV